MEKIGRRMKGRMKKINKFYGREVYRYTGLSAAAKHLNDDDSMAASPHRLFALSASPKPKPQARIFAPSGERETSKD